METSPAPTGPSEHRSEPQPLKDVNPFFQLRRSSRNFLLDAKGYWSYPALILGTDKSLCWLHIVLPAVTLPEKKRTALFRPKAVVITKAQSTVVVRYENFRLGHDPFPTLPWNKPVAMFPHKSLWKLSYKDLKERETALLADYAEAQSEFAATSRLPDAFRQSYLALIHPIFLPYVRYFAPAFGASLALS